MVREMFLPYLDFRTLSRFALVTALSLGLMNTPSRAQQGRVALVRDAEIEELMRDYALPLLKVAGLSQRGVEIVLVNDDSFNAFVAGRRIFVNTGTVLAAETPNEIIGVIAHEAGHLAGGHQQRLREQISRAKTMAVVGGLLGAGAIVAGSVAGNRGGASAGGALMSAVPGVAMRSLLSYRRSEEMNADQAAVKYLAATGQSAKGMLATFQRFSHGLALAGVQVDPYQLSHPLPRERIAMLEELARQSPHFDRQDQAGLTQRHALARAKVAAYSGGQAQVASIFGRDRSSLAGRYGDAIATDLAGNSRAALQKMEALIQASPNNPYFHEFRGEILLKLRRAGDAAAAFGRAMKLGGDTSGLIESRYGFALLTTGDPGSARKAIDSLRRAIQNGPDNLNAYLNLSQAYGLTGDVGNAELALAEGHFQAGNRREAQVFAARAAAKLPPGTPAAKRANDILSVGN